MHQPIDESPADHEALLARLHESELRVVALTAHLERAERLATIGTTAAIVAHEFNNILTPVLSYAQLAQASQNNVDLVSEALQRTIEAVVRATEIGSSILGFVRSDGDPDPKVCVADCFQETLRCLARSPERDGVRIEINADTNCIAAIRPVALQQVLLNLVLNACDAMRPGGGTLTLTVRCSTWNNEKAPRSKGIANAARPAASAITIEVSDTGRGASPELLQRMFDPFVTERTCGQGTGLGLAVCKRLIEEAGGAISVTSVVDEGTRFTILLPAVERVARPRVPRGTAAA